MKFHRFRTPRVIMNHGLGFQDCTRLHLPKSKSDFPYSSILGSDSSFSTPPGCWLLLPPPNTPPDTAASHCFHIAKWVFSASQTRLPSLRSGSFFQAFNQQQHFNNREALVFVKEDNLEMEQSASKEIQLATASTNNEDQNTEKEADISGGNEKKNDDLIIEISKIVKRTETQLLEECRIYRLPRYLRKWNEEAYTPQVISIGPYHHENQRLKAMEEHKERYFRSFMKRSERSLEYLVGTVREMEERIRRCYEETIDLTSDSFVKMILLDACFILELLFRRSSLSLTSHEDSMVVEPRAAAVKVDLLLFENQLPFFVIKKLQHLAYPSLPDALFFKNIFSYFDVFTDIQYRQPNPNAEIAHFTDLLRTFMLPPPEESPERINEHPKLLYSATQLHKAGVRFRLGKSERSFEIKFEDGVLEIPKLEIEGETEVVIRNVMALEQTCYIGNAYFTDYFIFLDYLINSRKDVDLLTKKKVLVNYLGDNNAVMSMINNLNKGIVSETVRVDYRNLYEELNRFYEKSWHRWEATLKSEYFSTPWRFASTVAAIVLLLLTFMQTASSMIDLLSSRSILGSKT
ncbi:UPF0481 protein At3g47200-like isoform X6 [Quercus robur]|uniref:UPF0481 protein At3g47200-like isoform X6 n=2 Tax=Quercus robur TaxID=38942 RepID=UPI002162A7F2|nr:UPF0481 protein At3g47200-like isoform X6 [Quercus robur]